MNQALKRKHFFRNLLIFLAIMGPGIITASVDNDAGGITTYSLAGAHFGYSLLWSLIPITIMLIIIQEISARMGVVTGKGFAELIRENFGLKVTFYAMLALLIANIGNTMAEFSGVAASMEIFGVSKYISVPIGAFFVWLLILKGNYKVIERVFLGASVVYVSYIISGVMANPPWGTVLRSTVVPSFSFDPHYMVMLMGIIGTTIAPWMQFYIQSSVVEKGLKLRSYKYTVLDVSVGGLVTGIVAFFTIAACAATLFTHGIRIETAKDAALALRPFAGNYCSALFAFGLFNASLFAASILPLATAYSICEAMGWELGVNKHFREASAFYILYALIIIVGAGATLIPNFPLITTMYLSQVLNGILLPFVLIFMLMLVNNKSIMGRYTNSLAYNILSWASAAVIIALTILMLVTFVLPAIK
jgi:Mn2+/Fe2+ NRAMP family transporter